MGPSITVVDDPDRIASTLTGVRRRLLAALDEPDSATGLSRRTGISRQRVNYHLRALEEEGFVELVEERPKRGLTERIVRRASDVILVDPATFDFSGLETADVAGLAGVIATAAGLVRQAAIVGSQASAHDARVAAATLDTEIRLSSPAALRSMVEEIAAVVARYDSGQEGLAMRVSTMVLPVEQAS